MLPLPDTLPATIAQLRTLATAAIDHRTIAFGLNAMDGHLAGGRLRAEALHEATLRSCSPADDAAATLFLAGIAARESKVVGGPVLWVPAARRPRLCWIDDRRLLLPEWPRLQIAASGATRRAMSQA